MDGDNTMSMEDMKNAETFSLETVPAVADAEHQQPVVLSAAAQQLTALLEIWKTALTPVLSRRPLSPAQNKAASSASVSVTTLITKTATTEVFDIFRQFFIDNKDGLCNRDKPLLLAGSKPLDFATARRVAFLCHVFSITVNPTVLSVKGERLTAVLGCPALIPYLREHGVVVV